MLYEAALDLIIAIYSIFTSIIFGLVSIKQRRLLHWLIGWLLACIIYSIGSFFIFLQVFIKSFRLIGNILYLIAVISFIAAVFRDYYQIFKDTSQTPNNHIMREISFFVTSISIPLLLIELLMGIFLFIAMAMLIRICLKIKSPTYGFMFLTIFGGFFSLVSTILYNFNIEGTWELSYVCNIIFISFLLGTVIVVYLENRLIISEKKYRESEEKIRNIAEFSHELILRLSFDGTYILVNHAASEFFGVPKEELIGKKFFKSIYPDDQIIVEEVIQKLLETGEPIPGFLTRMNVPKGLRTISWNCSAVRDENGKIIELQAIGRDITRQLKLQEELIEKNKLAAIGRLAAGVAHQLNTPLANITLKTDYISEIIGDDKSSNKTKMLLKEIISIKNQAKFCAQVVKELLQFSRKMDLDLKPIELGPLLNELVEAPAIASRINKNGVKVKIKKGEEVELIADRILLSQVFQNLVNNSLDVLEGKKDRPELNITLLKINSKIEIRVIDNGKGIKESDLPRIFEPFFSTK